MMSVRIVVFFVCVVACAVAHVVILVSIARRTSIPADRAVPAPRRGLEIVWALLPALVLALVVTATWNRMQQAPEPPVRMRVAQ